ncbi:hypothetical protein ACIREE_09640 [Streptomyces sp. NPDC102467]|uniref:hypothetical protein n=1 Tax=Streptomyces sp. NPDC102467 TaxID=3366179 RepID=UPI00380F44C6
MSTEARRVPPRPTTPPPPAGPPRPAHAPAPAQEGDSQLPDGAPPLPSTPPPPAPSSRFPDTPPRRSHPLPPETGPAGGSPSLPPEASPARGAGNGASNHDGTAPAHTTAAPHGGADAHQNETTTRLRPIPPAPAGPAQGARRAVGTVDLTPLPGTAGRPFVRFARPEHYDDSTTRLRPIGARLRPRAAAAAACLVLGLGLIGGAATGSLLTGDGAVSAQTAYRDAAELWHGIPVDRLFPRTLNGEGAGPGGADRTWTRIGVAPDSGCGKAFDPLLYKALRPGGCLRLLRATYTDATQSNVTTVGLMFTSADAEAAKALRTRFTEDGLDRRPDLVPRPYAVPGTVAADFGDAQRASWSINVLTDAPVVVYAVSGFADGRTVADPEPAVEAMKADATEAPAQAGLGHEAQGIADRVERGLRKAVQKSTEQPS